MEINFEVFRAIVEQHIPFHTLLGVKLMDIRPNFAQILIPYQKSFIGEIRENRIHGGVIMAGMDTVAGIASFTAIDMAKDRIATIDQRTDFLSPAGEADIIITAEVRKSGSRIIFVQMTAYHPSQPEVILAEGRSTYSVKRS
jgi:uncharacterized protein (TIGR00369 family)